MKETQMTLEDYEALLAPVKPEARKEFIMKAVIGVVLTLEEWAEDRAIIDQCEIFLKYNEINAGDDEALLDSARLLLANLKRIIGNNED